MRSRWSTEDIHVRARLVDRVKEILGDHPTLNAAALTFCTSFDSVSTVIPVAVSTEQLVANVQAMHHQLSQELRAELEEFYAREVQKLTLPW